MTQIKNKTFRFVLIMLVFFIIPILTPQSLVAALQGDFNYDGLVNALDWSTMNASWYTSDIQTDLNNDGFVNTIDFSILNSNWTKVPRPSYQIDR